MHIRIRLITYVWMLLCLLATACTSIGFELPQGPQGPDGKSAYDLWKEEVEAGRIDWPGDRTTPADFFVFVKGEKGDRGADGQSAYELWKQLIAQGTVANPHDGSQTWPASKNSEADFWDFISGRDGQTPHVGSNGNWFIGATDTGVKATGRDGRDGRDGLDGKDGLSAYEQWRQLVGQGATDWPKDQTSMNDFFLFLKGRDGANGITPHVGTNGHWFVGSTDTGVTAQGPKGDNGTNGRDGKDGLSPYVGTNGNWWVGTTDTGVTAKGRDGRDGRDGTDGRTPVIRDGHWWIGDTDTGIAAQGVRGEKGEKGDPGEKGKDGRDGKDGANGRDGRDGTDGRTPFIRDGHWWIGDTDTGIAAQGVRGEKGEKGDPGEKGKDGRDGADGKDGRDGTNGTNGRDGQNGRDGVSPHIGDNGNWFIGTTDTGIAARGQNGNDGAAGASAYELWQQDVKNGKVHDKEGQPWSKERTTMADFYAYLSGADGRDGRDGRDGANGTNGRDGINGKSAYELWKETIATGQVDDPKAPGTKWSAERNTEADFFNFLAGRDGVDGTNGRDGRDGRDGVDGLNGRDGLNGKDGANGLSAYELWKADLAKRCGTPEALTDHRDGSKWDCERNSLDDFYEFLRGADGADGKDGKDGRPGEPGKPGAEVTIIRGVPNVIAQYSQSEFGEYVRTTDGGVLYKVYDERGQLAPHAKVQGLPGINPGKEYTSNEQGEFIVPREDLPEIQELDSRWGTTRSVTLAGKPAQESARNTYVPNRVHMRMVPQSKTPSVDYQLNMSFRIQRRINPDDEWQNLPSYLPNSGSLHPETFRVADKDNPRSLLADRPVHCSNSTSSGSGSYIYNCYPYRYVQENPANQKNSQKEYWDGTDVYLTVKNREAYYGEEFQWNGVALLPPYQLGPRLKSLKLKTKSGGTPTVFLSAEGELDFSHMDLTRLYKPSTRYTQRPDGSDFIEPILYTEEEARKLKMAYVSFNFSSSAGTQEASSTNNRSSADEPTFKVLTPYLNSTIYIKYDSYHQFKGFTQGYLRPGTEEGTYRVEPYQPAYTLPEVTVTYEE